MRQSMSILTDRTLPKFSEELEAGWHYVFKVALNSNYPSEASRALRRFKDRREAKEWARNNIPFQWIVASKD